MVFKDFAHLYVCGFNLPGCNLFHNRIAFDAVRPFHCASTRKLWQARLFAGKTRQMKAKTYLHLARARCLWYYINDIFQGSDFG